MTSYRAVAPSEPLKGTLPFGFDIGVEASLSRSTRTRITGRMQ